jgi:hypothetical protein
MPRPTCYTSSSIGPCPTLCDNFLDRPETTSITWDDGFHFDDPSWFRTFHQCEPPEVFNVIDRLIAVHKHYDLILAWDERVLRECPNAVFLTESACSWLPRQSGNLQETYGTMNHSGILHKNPLADTYVGRSVDAKQFAVSFLTSSKNQFPGHVLRQEIYERLPEAVGALRTWKHRSPPIVNDKRTILEPFMFSIVPENSRHNGYYTEKIVDCFVAKTIPVYWGCTDIAKHFNVDGIVQFSNYEDLLEKLKSLTPEFYRDRTNAIEENFNKALLGVHQWDLIENAITKGIERKHANPEDSAARTPKRNHSYTQQIPRPLRWPGR